MDKRKDATAKIKNLVFYSPSREELQRCSTSRDQKSQKFLRDDSSTKFQTVMESSRITNDEILSKRDQLSQTQIIQAPKEVLPDTKTVVNDNRNITPQKFMSRLQKGQQYLPTLARSSMREGDNSMGSPQMARDSSTNELIESTLLKENKSELTRIYKNAREFQDLKLTKEKERLKITRDSDRIKAAMNKLSDDMAYTMTHNVQNIKTDVSHYFNEKRSRSPEQNVTLPEIKDQFKTKFHKLLQDINDDAKLSPEKNNVLAVTSRGESNLLNNTLKSSRFLTCEVSPLKRNQVFNTLHKDIRSVKTPMMKTRRDAEQTLNNKSQTSTSFMQQYPKAPGHSSEFLDDNVLQGLRKELPNLFSSNPSNRQEVLVLGNWMINTIKDVQEDEQLSKKDRFYRADEVYNLCFNELIRQVSFDCIERAELLMKIWKAYISLSEDIINDFREREKQVITKAKQECDKLREIHQKLLEDKDKDIERIKEELNIKDDIIKEKNERIERFNDDQSENINQARQASEALTKIQKLYLSLKQEHKDVNFKFEKIKKRLAAEDLADLDKNNDIPSDSSSDDEERRDYMFGNRQTKIIKRETKETTTSDLMEWAKNGTEVPGVSTQTNLALMHKRYNPIFRGNDVLDDILREKAAKKKLLREGELMANMTGLSTNEIVEKRRASHLVETRRSSIMSEIEEKKLCRSGSSKIKDVVSKSQVVDSVINEKINYKINVFGEQQPSQGLQGSHSARLVPKIDISVRRESIMSTRSDRIIRNNNQDNQPDTDRSPRENMNNGTDDSDNDSLVDCKDNKGNYKDIYETNDVLESAKIESRKVDGKASKKSKIKKRNSAKEEYFGTSDKSEKLVIKREDSASKGVLASTNSPVRIKKAGTGSVSLTKKRNSRKGTEGEESIDPKQEQDDNPQTISAFKSKVKVSIGKRGNKQDPESRMVLNNNSNVDNHNSLAGATEEFKAALRQTKPALDPASQVLRAKKDDVAQKGLTLEMTKSLTVNPNPGKPDKPYTLNIPLLSPITMREFPNGDASSKSSAFDLKGASLRLDDSPKEKSDGTSFTSRESRPVKSVANAIKAIKKIALLKGADNKSKALNGIAETLAQVDEDNEAAAQLIESQEQKIIRFTNLYKIEKKKQEDLRALNRELERQVIEDGVIIETFQRLVEELSLASEMTDMQKRKVETLVSVMEIRSKNLEAIDEMKPKLDPAFIGSIVQGIKIAAESPRRRLFEDQFTLSSLLPESKYKGDFMVDVVLSPGQKFLLAEKLNNPMNATLAKVKRDLQTKKTKVNAIMPIKSLLKQITIFYTEKVHQGKDNPMLKEQDMGIFVYKQFINTYGLGKYAVQKFVKFVTSLKRHLNINRVNNFAKMVNVLDTGSNYSLVEVRQYLHGLEFFMYHSTAGIHFPNPDHQKAHYIPFSRALEYLRYYTEKHGQEEDLHIFKKELEKLRIVDPSRINVSGLIDIDIFLEKMVARHKAYVAKAEEALLTGFISADFLREKKIKFADFLVLHKAIEGDRNEDKKLEEAFVSYCDVLDDEHLALSKEKFFTLSYDYNIFSKQKINAYLGLKDDIEFERKFEMFRSKWDEEQETIRNNIEKCQAVLPHEIVTKWKSISEIIGQDIDKNESHIRKSILVRHKILTTDIANNISAGSG